MSDLEHIGDDTLHTSLMEMSIRGILNEDDLDEIPNPFDREEVTTGVLDKMHALIAPLGDINSTNWPAFSTQIEKIRSEIDGIATRGSMARFFSKGGKRAKDLVNGLAQLKLYARALGDRIKPGADTQIANIIHDLPEDRKAMSLKNALDSEVRNSLAAYINTLHRDHNQDKVLDKLGFGRKAATAAFLELKGEDIKSIAGVLNGIPIPPPRDTATGDADGDGIPNALDTTPPTDNPQEAGRESTTSMNPSRNDDDEEQETNTPRDKAPDPTNPQPGELYRRTTAKGAEQTVSIAPAQDPTVPPEKVQVQKVVDGKPKGGKYAVERSGLSTLETEEPAGTEIMTLDAFNTLVNNNRDDFAKIANDGAEGAEARTKVVNDLLKGKRFAENLVHSLEAHGLSLLVEEVRIANLDHGHDTADFRRWRLLAGM